MKRRLNMAAGIIHRPRVVLMDEPTVGVDPQSRNRIFEMIEALRAQGTAIVYTTHYMEEAERLCDRIAIIDHGRIIALGTKEELVHNAFASRSQVLARFAGSEDQIAAWVERHGGRIVDWHLRNSRSSVRSRLGLCWNPPRKTASNSKMSLSVARISNPSSSTSREGSCANDPSHRPHRLGLLAPRSRRAGA